MNQQSARQFLRLALLPMLIVVLGMAGYIYLEGWDWADAFYMTVITLSTVGFGEVQTLSRMGRLFTAVLILAGVGVLTIAFTAITNAVVAGQVTGAWHRSRLKRRLRKMQDHFIVCGYGRVGGKVVEQLSVQNRKILVVDKDGLKQDQIAGDTVFFLQGNATDESVLRQAGIDRAAGLCLCLPDDAGNLFAVLTARTLNRHIHITVRTQDERAEDKMRFAGANNVVNPTSMAGYSMAIHLVQPHVIRAMEFLRQTGMQGYMLESVQVGHSPQVIHRTIGEIGFRQRLGLNVLQILRQDQTLIPDIKADTAILPEDTLLLLGPQEALAEFCMQLQLPTSAVPGD